MQGYIDITSKYMKYHKKRTIFTVLGIVLAIALFSSISTLMLSNKDAEIELTRKSTGNYEVEYKRIDETKLDKIINHAETSNYGIVQETRDGRIENGNVKYKVDIKSYNKSAYEDIFKGYFDIKEGRLPSDENEIVIENRALYTLGAKLGDSVAIIGPSNNNMPSSKEYKIVGTYEEKFFSADIFNGITYIKDESTKKTGTYNVFVNLKEKKDKSTVANRIAGELGLKINGNSDDSQVNINEQLLRMEGLMHYSVLDDSNLTILAVLLLIIIICSATVIYNSFNISVMERIKQFGVLRAIGATPRQIRGMVFKEAFYMCLISIPTGIVAGYAGLIAIMQMVKKIRGIDYNGLKIGLYPEVIMICIVLGVLTVMLSVWAPARNAGKVSPMDAIRNIGEIKNEKIKLRKTGLIKFLFKYEGELAYKNIKRTPKRFWFTVSSLIISIVLLIVYSSFMSVVKQLNDRDHDISNADAMFGKINDLLTEDEISEIRNLGGIDKIYLKAQNSCYFAFPKEYLNPDYEIKTGRKTRLIEGTDFVATGNTIMSFYDDNGLKIAKKYLLDGEIDKEKLDNMGVLLVNKNRVISEPGNKQVTADFSSYKVGDKIVVPKLDAYNYQQVKASPSEKPVDQFQVMKESIKNNDFYTFTVVGILGTDFIDGLPQDGLGLVFTEDVYKKINGGLASSTMLIKYKDNASRENLYEYFNKKASQIAGYYYDYYKLAEQERNTMAQANLYVYSFIALITLISAVNIINTIVISVMLRKREFASLRAIGMTEAQLTKMILFEGLIQGVIAAIVGIIIGGILTKVIINMIVSDMKANIPYEILITGIVVSVLLTLTASMIPMNRLKKMNIMESLRIE